MKQSSKYILEVLTVWLLIWNALAFGIEYIQPGFVVNSIQTKWLAVVTVVIGFVYLLILALNKARGSVTQK